MIELKEVSKIFDTGFNKVNALSNVDIKIDQGEFVAIKGPSGSGKSTMMNIIGLLDRPSHGKYLLGKVRKSLTLGVIFFALIPFLNKTSFSSCVSY